MRESKCLAFDLEFKVNCHACLLDGIAEDTWLNPPCVEPLAHFGHNVRKILSIAADFNSYWTRGNKDRTVRILQPEARVSTATRVTLTAAVRIVLRNGLQLLGVPTPDAM